jgi:hypothetical protein
MPTSFLAVRCAVLLVSFCVFFIALGVPATVLSACSSPDLVTASILEGLSLAQSIYYCQRAAIVSPAVERTFSFELTIFDSSLFHPPIS